MFQLRKVMFVSLSFAFLSTLFLILCTVIGTKLLHNNQNYINHNDPICSQLCWTDVQIGSSSYTELIEQIIDFNYYRDETMIPDTTLTYVNLFIDSQQQKHEAAIEVNNDVIELVILSVEFCISDFISKYDVPDRIITWEQSVGYLYVKQQMALISKDYSEPQVIDRVHLTTQDKFNYFFSESSPPEWNKIIAQSCHN